MMTHSCDAEILSLPGTPEEREWLREHLEVLGVKEGIILSAAMAREPPQDMAEAVNHLLTVSAPAAVLSPMTPWRTAWFPKEASTPGRLADFLLLSDPVSFQPELVYKEGRCIYDAAAPQVPAAAGPSPFPEDFYHTVQVASVATETFRLPAPEGASRVEVRVIEVFPTVTQTKERRMVLPIRDGCIDWQSGDCALAAVLERHGKSGGIAFGLVAGSGLHSGAIATTYFHDHHNLFVLGRDPGDMAAAVNRLRESQGGILTVRGGEVTAHLPLPVCGLLSENSAEQVGADLRMVREQLHAMGYVHRAPIMSLCTLGLPVSPALKLTDKGLVDVRAGRLVELVTGLKA